MNQKTNFEYEVLIHDDASTDGTAEIIREYQSKYPETITAVCKRKSVLKRHQGGNNVFIS